MAVPKKKTSKGRTTRRYHSYKTKQLRRMQKNLTLVACPDCGAMKLNHHVCKTCGKYNGKQIIDMNKNVDKITTLKA